MYAQYNSETYPKTWVELTPYIGTNGKVFICPGAPKVTNGYGMNAAIGNMSMASIADPSQVVITADSGNPTNMMNSPADIAYRHGARDMAIVSYADGHAAPIKKSDLVSLSVQ